MSFVSYARHAEDVLLWRALHEVEKGFFLEVGAESPLAGNVSQAFYGHGWRGVNLVADAAAFERFTEQRPEDVNLHVRVADAQTVVADTGADHVPAVSLDAVCAKHAPNVIHFLRLAATGAVDTVIVSLDLERYRPQIILLEGDGVAESTATILNHAYARVYADGLNSIYLADECAALKPAFLTPPNARDDFVPFREVKLQQQLAGLQERLDTRQPLALAADFQPVDVSKLEQAVWGEDSTGLRMLFQRQGQIEELLWRLARAQEQLADLEAERLRYQVLLEQQHAQELAHQQRLFELDQRIRSLTDRLQEGEQREQRLVQEKDVVLKELHNVYHGTIWRMATPVRWLGDHGKPALRKLKGGVKPKLGKVLRKGKALLMRNQRIAGLISAALENNPGIRRRLRKLAGLDVVGQRWDKALPENLSHKAADIYQKLQSNNKGS